MGEVPSFGCTWPCLRSLVTEGWTGWRARPEQVRKGTATMSRRIGARRVGADVVRSRMLRDLRRRPGSALVIIFAVAFSCAIGGLGAAIGVQSFASTGALMKEARTPHLVQMHAGEIDPAAVEQFAAEDDRVEATKLQELVGIDAASLSLTPGATQEGSAMEYSVMVQNHDYDIIVGDRQSGV